ncbi:sulfatase [Marinilabilia rubra]|nr:sulfatase [Marinilabilia rubra]
MNQILFKVILGITVMTLFSCKTQSQESSPVNVLFISVDDLKPTLGTYGDEKAISPNIDNLAKSGVQFNNAYCQQAVCAPSRISLFSGLRPDRTKVWDLKTQMRDVIPNAVTIPQYFKQNGYETVGLGKLMHGAKDNDPVSWTIPYKKDNKLEYAKGFKYPANGKYQNPETHKAMKEAKKQKLGWRATNQYLKKLDLAPSVECIDIPDDAYEDGAIANAAIELLDRLPQGDKPFFLSLGFHKPHLPFSVPKKYWDLYDRDKIELADFTDRAENSPGFAYHNWGELRNYSDIPQKGDLITEKQKEIIHGYYASVSYVDAQIGKVLEKLKASGLDKNTIVILWGDHGWHLGDHGMWCKHTNFEQATHSPLIISAPGLNENLKANTMTEFVDIYPTLCELTGLPVPEFTEGKSLKPALLNPETQVKDFAISQYPRGDNRMGYSMRTQRYRLTLWIEGPFREADVLSSPQIESVELYDYKKDPNETVSLAGKEEYKEIEAKLTNKLIKLLQDQQASGRAGCFTPC